MIDRPPPHPGTIFEWSRLPGFDGYDQPPHSLVNGSGEHEEAVFIAGDDLVVQWRYIWKIEVVKANGSTGGAGRKGSDVVMVTKRTMVPVTVKSWRSRS